MTRAVTLPIAPDPERRWWVGPNAGAVFQDDVDFDGLVLTLELRSPEEADAVATALLAGSAP